MARNNLALHQKTKIAQRLPGDLEDKIVDFHRFVLNCRKKDNYELVNIGNMDETPVWFDTPSARTVTTQREKTVSISTTGHSCPFLPGWWNEIEADGHFQAKNSTKR